MVVFVEESDLRDSTNDRSSIRSESKWGKRTFTEVTLVDRLKLGIRMGRVLKVVVPIENNRCS